MLTERGSARKKSYCHLTHVSREKTLNLGDITPTTRPWFPEEVCAVECLPKEFYQQLSDPGWVKQAEPGIIIVDSHQRVTPYAVKIT